ncbi:translocation protein SEC63 [Nematocida homosporus]|uniref:translocation protein SEC63 n=1 Tax=Nematocida homosporus TaxID=1912981 RepID=UPI00221FCF23|nr:translocation protein SEC63 [Nematocida homosporus]KAI5184268.1 translocation protein SEC63 [Nematocida homosporus]
MHSKYEYDSSGVSSSLLAVGLLVPIVLGTYSRAFSKKEIKSLICGCSECQRGVKRSRGLNWWQIIFWSACCLLVLPLRNIIVREYGRSGTFDPYKVLGVAKAVGAAGIEKAYREKLRETKFKVRDRRKSKEVLQEVIRAHQTLSDAKLRENWDNFGEGEKKESHVVAIPAWAMKKSSAGFMLAVYLVLLGVILPRVVSAIWKISFNYAAVGLEYRSTERLYQRMKGVKKCFTLNTLVEWLAEDCFELSEYKWRTPSSNLKHLVSILVSECTIPLSSNEERMGVVIGFSMLCLRNEQVLASLHQDDIGYAQDILLKGAKAIRMISLVLKQKEIYYLGYDLERAVVQSVPDVKYWEMQYPDISFTDTFINCFEGKKEELVKSAADQRVDQSMFKAKITAIDLYTTVEGPITKEEYITGSLNPNLRVVITKEGSQTGYKAPVHKRLRREEIDFGDLSLLETDLCPELNPVELEKAPVLLRHTTCLPVHAPLCRVPQTYDWAVVVEVNGVPLANSPPFTPGPCDTEVLFKLPALQTLSTQKRVIIDIRLISCKFFGRDVLARKSLTLK